MEHSNLTVIIPFVNEKYELQETLESIRQYSLKAVDIILINDASEDGFDYGHLAKLYDAVYVEHKERIGVAASRDEGVNICQTDFFLLLDAHMRFYDNLWIDRIVSELKKDPKAFLCCQTKALYRDNGFLKEDVSRMTSYGACVDLYNPLKLFEPKWVVSSQDSYDKNTINIPCVLGATYACNKLYWIYLKGLNGLKQYGNDEAYISIKVWLSGGSCKLLKDIVIGHVYRSTHPYQRKTISCLYNRMFLCSVFLSYDMLRKTSAYLNLCYDNKILSKVHQMLYENRNEIKQLKEYYRSVFVNDFTYFTSLNDKYLPQSKYVDDVEHILLDIAYNISNSHCLELGLLSGQMGNIIYLYHYAHLSYKQEFIVKANQLLSELIHNISLDISYCFATGLCGIGWGIEYLYQHDFIILDINKTLSYIDRKVLELNPDRIDDINKNYGLGGIVLYILARLRSINIQKIENPFDNSYLYCLYLRLKEIINKIEICSDSIDIFISFIQYYEKKEPINKPNIYDASHLSNLKNIPIQDLDAGLKGYAGVGLNFILNR